MTNKVLVYGAAGHTGRFVVAELLRRRVPIVAAGRDANRLQELKAKYPTAETRVASIDEVASIDKAMADVAVVINCAGPFLDTAASMIESAIRTGVHYLDIAAEQAAVLSVFERYSQPARDAEIVVAPAMGFYGGLTDLLVGAAACDWETLDACDIAVALDSWHPTRGTRLTGERNAGPRWFFFDGKLERRDPLPPRQWDFPQPFGHQDVVNLALAETILISRHYRPSDIRFYLNKSSIADLSNPNTPAPKPVDSMGRSAQTFVVDAIVRQGDETRRAIAFGRDIYAVTAPIVVEAATRILSSRCEKTGVRAAAELFNPREFLTALDPQQLEVEFGA